MKIKRKAWRAETGCGRLPPLGGRLRSGAPAAGRRRREHRVKRYLSRRGGFSGGLIALSATYPAAVVFAARSSR